MSIGALQNIAASHVELIKSLIILNNCFFFVLLAQVLL